MQEQTTLRPGCKINTYLEILHRRSDGYHELISLFHPLSRPSDTLYVSSLHSGGGLNLTCSRPELENGDNILHSAYQAFAAASGFRPDLRVHLEKEVPVGSGLGGASANAAALLKYMNACLEPRHRLEEKGLARTAARVGSDVPFFLLGETARVTGAGERVERAASASLQGKEGLLVVCPHIGVSTAWAYQAFDGAAGSGRTEFFPSLLTREGKKDTDFARSAGQVWFNAFEEVVFCSYPELRSLKHGLLKTGARAATLSGSGSAIAVFADKALPDCVRWLERNSLPYFVAA